MHQNFHPARNALDGNHGTHVTVENTATETGKIFWKIVFNKRVFVHHIKIVNRNDDCCPQRGNNLDIQITVINSVFRMENICGNTGILGVEKTFDCNQYADEVKVFPAGTAGIFHFADAYFYGISCFI